MANSPYAQSKIQCSFFTKPFGEKTNPKQPDINGYLEIGVEDLAEFTELVKVIEPTSNWQGNNVVKLRFAGWNKTSSRTGKHWLSGSIQPDKAAEFKGLDELQPSPGEDRVDHFDSPSPHQFIPQPQPAAVEEL